MPKTLACALAVLMLMTLPNILLAADDWPLPRAEPALLGLSPDGLKEIADALDADIREGKIPGAVLLIARRGKIGYFEAFGDRDPETDAPMKTDAIFSIASMTKPMVSVGIMMLVEEGKVALDDPVGKHLPRIANLRVAVDPKAKSGPVETRPAKRQPTIEDLLRHTSGMTSGNRGKSAVNKLWPYSGARAAVRMTGDELLELIAKLPLLHDPGTSWDYGFSTDVLGLVIEKISGQKLSAFLSERDRRLEASASTIGAARTGLISGTTQSRSWPSSSCPRRRERPAITIAGCCRSSSTQRSRINARRRSQMQQSAAFRAVPRARRVAAESGFVYPPSTPVSMNETGHPLGG